MELDMAIVEERKYEEDEEFAKDRVSSRRILWQVICLNERKMQICSSFYQI
jgi:hypothetical protein